MKTINVNIQLVNENNEIIEKVLDVNYGNLNIIIDRLKLSWERHYAIVMDFTYKHNEIEKTLKYYFTEESLFLPEYKTLINRMWFECIKALQKDE